MKKKKALSSNSNNIKHKNIREGTKGKNPKTMKEENTGEELCDLS